MISDGFGQVEIEYTDNRGLAWLMPEEAQRLVQRGEARLTGRTRTLSPENQDAFQIGGHVVLELFDADGELKERRETDNLVVNTGLYHIADQLAEQDESAMSHMAVGTDDTAAAAGNTTLGSEAGRVALSSTTQGAGASADEVTYVGAFGAGTGTGALVEAGILNADSGGILLCRTVFDVINKGASDSLTITWVLTISAS